MFHEALETSSVANWGPGVDSDTTNESVLRERPLMGVPVSVKGMMYRRFSLQSMILIAFLQKQLTLLDTTLQSAILAM